MGLLLTSSRRNTLIACFALAARHRASAFASLPSRRSFVSSSSRNSSSSSSLSMSKTVLVPIADGSEEIETTCITDTLTRFGASVTTASVTGDLVCTMSRGIKVQADVKIEDAVNTDWDLVVLPGGMPGAEHLRDSKPLVGLLKRQREAGKMYGAICAAPAVALAPNGLLPDKGGAATCYPAPAFREQLPVVSEDPVVVTDNITTSQGPGTALAFALQLGENLFGKEKRDEIAKQMLL